jgi:RNA polymerase sigma-70 factor (sigma-E family)
MSNSDLDFDEFCRVMSPRLVGALVLQVGDRGRAEDIAQEALARAWSRWRSVAQMAEPQGWVFTVAFRLAIGGTRRRGSERRANKRAAARHEEPDEAIDELVVDQLTLEPALRAMTPRQRAAIALRYYADFSVARTAQVMGCAEGTVKALTSQGIERLRSVLAEPTSDLPSTTTPRGETL